MFNIFRKAELGGKLKFVGNVATHSLSLREFAVVFFEIIAALVYQGTM